MRNEKLCEIVKDSVVKVYEQGYKDGRADGYDAGELFGGDYQKGLNDAWECARRVINCDVPYDFWELASGQSNLAIFKHYSAQGAIAKIKEYEEKQKQEDKIKVGDEVIYDSENCVITAIANGGHTLMLLGLGGGYMVRTTPESIKKTGRRFSQIEEVLKQMQEEAE